MLAGSCWPHPDASSILACGAEGPSWSHPQAVRHVAEARLSALGDLACPGLESLCLRVLLQLYWAARWWRVIHHDLRLCVGPILLDVGRGAAQHGCVPLGGPCKSAERT